MSETLKLFLPESSAPGWQRVHHPATLATNAALTTSLSATTSEAWQEPVVPAKASLGALFQYRGTSDLPSRLPSSSEPDRWEDT